MYCNNCIYVSLIGVEHEKMAANKKFKQSLKYLGGIICHGLEYLIRHEVVLYFNSTNTFLQYLFTFSLQLRSSSEASSNQISTRYDFHTVPYRFFFHRFPYNFARFFADFRTILPFCGNVRKFRRKDFGTVLRNSTEISCLAGLKLDDI